MTEASRIAVLNFVHETVTCLPNDAALDDFVHDGSPARGEALLAWEPRSYMGGFVKVAREHAGVELVGIESPLWPRTGTGSGWITREAYEHFLSRMLAELERGGRWHGVYLALHGRARRGAARGRHRPPRAGGRGPRGLHRWHLRSAWQRGRRVSAPGRLRVLREILPALRQPPAGRARGSHADPRHPPRLHPRHRHGEGADPDRDGAAMDWRFTVDGPGPARPGLGSA